MTLALTTAPAAPLADALHAASADALLPRLLDEIDYGLMLLDVEGGRLLLANRAARVEFADGRAVRCVGDRLLVARASDTAGLALALLDAARGRRTLLNLGSGEARLALSVIPLMLGGGRPGALIIAGRRQLCETLSVEMFARCHGLTGAEVHVLQALCTGLPPAKIADEFGVKLATVRTQVAAIRSKTEAASIRELVRKVAALPPMVPALREALAA